MFRTSQHLQIGENIFDGVLSVVSHSSVPLFTGLGDCSNTNLIVLHLNVQHVKIERQKRRRYVADDAAEPVARHSQRLQGHRSAQAHTAHKSEPDSYLLFWLVSLWFWCCLSFEGAPRFLLELECQLTELHALIEELQKVLLVSFVVSMFLCCVSCVCVCVCVWLFVCLVVFMVLCGFCSVCV